MINSDLLAWCVKCRERRLMIEASPFTTKNGRPAVRGKCGICGGGLIRLGDPNPSPSTSPSEGS